MFLGIDIGTSTVKAALFDVEGVQVADARVPAFSTGEFDPRDWWIAVCDALAKLDLSRVEAVGVCGRGGTGVFLDAYGEVAFPSFDDDRAAAELRAVRDAHTGLSPQSQRLLAKASHAVATGADIATAFAAKDYAIHMLTGALTTDAASGGTHGKRLAPLLPTSDPWSAAGTVMQNAAALTGLPTGVPVAVGWHDGAAATLGSGAAKAGASPITLGTTAVYRVVLETLPDGLPRYWDLTPGLTVTGGDIAAAGRAFAWARELLAGADPALSPPGANGLTFLPQFAGRIAPTVNRAALGAWLGLDGTQSYHDMLRAVVEGTAFSLRQVRDWLASNGAVADTHIANGGGARNPLQVQVLADVLQTPVQVADVEEGCRGAALLGAVAAGKLTLEQARLLAPATRIFEPNAANGDVYDIAYQQFLALQDASDKAWPPKR